MTKRKHGRILVIGDLHCPFHHKDAFKFLAAVKKKFKPDTVIQVGDEIDGNKISFHEKSPDIPFSPSSELEKAIWYLKDLYKLFPNVYILESNHGSLIYRRQKFAGIPRTALREWSEILEAPSGWRWSYDLEIRMSNGRELYCHHGLSKNVVKASQNKSTNYLSGHFHSEFNISYWANHKDIYFAMSVGCLIDHKSMAFEYGKNHLAKPILGCAMIINGVPQLIPMPLNKKGRWIGKLNG